MSDDPGPTDSTALTDDVSPTTPDGIPLIVNGVRLTQVQVDALREARARQEDRSGPPAEKEIGGADRETEPTRYGDWEKAGRAIDFS